jgi:hypothetical protein
MTSARKVLSGLSSVPAPPGEAAEGEQADENENDPEDRAPEEQDEDPDDDDDSSERDAGSWAVAPLRCSHFPSLPRACPGSTLSDGPADRSRCSAIFTHVPDRGRVLRSSSRCRADWAELLAEAGALDELPLARAAEEFVSVDDHPAAQEHDLGGARHLRSLVEVVVAPGVMAGG